MGSVLGDGLTHWQLLIVLSWRLCSSFGRICGKCFYFCAFGILGVALFAAGNVLEGCRCAERRSLAESDLQILVSGS